MGPLLGLTRVVLHGFLDRIRVEVRALFVQASPERFNFDLHPMKYLFSVARVYLAFIFGRQTRILAHHREAGAASWQGLLSGRAAAARAGFASKLVEQAICDGEGPNDRVEVEWIVSGLG